MNNRPKPHEMTDQELRKYVKLIRMNRDNREEPKVTFQPTLPEYDSPVVMIDSREGK